MSQTPSLPQVIGDQIEARLTGLHTMLPGRVTKVDLAKGKCDVAPLLMRITSSGTAVPLPVISNCPIGFYRAGTAAVYLPLAIGHGVEIRFCERSLDIWLTKGGTVDPKDKRKHHLSDATAYPGMYPQSDPPVGADAKNIVVINAIGKLVISPEGKFQIQGANDELLKCVIDLIAKLKTVKTPTMLGPQGFLSEDITDLEAIRTRVEGMKL